MAPCQDTDIDSFLGYLTSLRACRLGFSHQPVPLVKQNITTDRFTEGFRCDSSPNEDGDDVFTRVTTLLQD